MGWRSLGTGCWIDKRREDHGIKESAFDGFSPDTRYFLYSLFTNDSREWFQEHIKEYQEHLLHPMQNLVRSLADTMLSIDPGLDVAPVVGRTISRIYHDARSSRNKPLFRNSMWITFKRPRKNWLDTPVFFFETNPVIYQYGMGVYKAKKATMDRFREAISKNPEEFLKTVAFLDDQKVFKLEGDKYKRTLDPSQPPEIQDWYQQKNLYLVCDREIDDHFFGREILDDLINGFKTIAPLYYYLWKVCGG